ncbi:MAG: hypothetical protein AB1750_03825 [Chloroflexota bacterium]
MKIIRNEKLIKRNSKIGQFTSLAALVVLFGGMYISFTKPEYFTWSIIALIAGFTLTQIGMYFGNRWGRRPRPDEQLDAALKGIPGEYTLYHYSSPVSHLMVGPAGIWVILPYTQKGKVFYHKNRWKGSGGGFLQAYMRIFGQESIGRPDVEAGSEVTALDKFFKKNFAEGEAVPPINVALAFLDPNIEIDAADAPLPTLQAKKLKDYIRKFAKENPFPQAELEKARAALEKD